MNGALRVGLLLLLSVSLASGSAARGDPARAHGADAPLELASIDGPGTYQVGWRLVETEHEFGGRLDAGATRNLKLVVEQENVTDVSFALIWYEDEDSVGVSQEDAFELAVEKPDGLPAADSPGRSRAGSIVVSSGLVNPVPGPVVIDASSAADAYAELAPHTGREGLGAWKVAIHLTDAGNPKGTSVDTGNSYRLIVLVRHYEPVLMRVVSLGPPPTLSLKEAAGATPAAWVWSAGALGVASVGLAGFLAVDAWRQRR